MKEYLNKNVKLHIRRSGADLFFKALVNEVTNTHITFTDKYGKLYTFLIENIVQINEE